MEWLAYWQVEPPLDLRIDVGFALLQAQQYNMNRGQGREARGLRDFLPQWWSPEEPSEEQDGMAPERVMSVLERMMENQEKMGRQKKDGA